MATKQPEPVFTFGALIRNPCVHAAAVVAAATGPSLLHVSGPRPELPLQLRRHVRHREPAGWSVVHGAGAEVLVVPLKTPARVIGVAVLRPERIAPRLSEGQVRTLEDLAEQVAIAVERRRDAGT